MQTPSVSDSYARSFQARLLDWSQGHPRPLPWKETKDPYAIWLSEIILQQTRVAQGWDYYLKFIEAFPTVHDLAAASESQVLNLWQGLGYYSRARNLHATARHVASALGGRFPKEPTDLQRLKGIGPYTAAAIASFAYDYPAAVVDGNVFRVLSRIHGIHAPIDTGAGKRLFQELAGQLLDKGRPAAYNQAMLNFGAMQCVPKSPDCSRCPFAGDCVAYREDRVAEFPIKARRLLRKDRFFNYLVLSCDEAILLCHRRDKDIWQGLYDFPLWESPAPASKAQIHKYFIGLRWLRNGQMGRLGPSRKQVLTHQNIHGQFYEVRVSKPPLKLNSAPFVWVPRQKLDSYAFPRIIDLYLADKHLYLDLQ